MAETRERKDLLSAAECAARTGLTVRALHVYERYGLIVPKRTEKGWRIYDQQNITRLNVITALKAIGLSLSQIRDIVRVSPPSLDRILEIQVKTWRARKAEAEQGLALAEAVLAQLQSRQSLTMEDLCNLILNFEADGLKTVIDEVVEDQYSPTEMHSLSVWAKEHWPASEAFTDAFVKMRGEASKLVAAGVEPSSADAQAFIERVMTHEHANSIFRRARQVGGLFLNAAKGQEIAKALVERMARDSRAKNHLAVEVFIDSARQIRLESSEEWGRFSQASGTVVADLRHLIQVHADPASPEAREILDRFSELGHVFSLGDPVFYALWVHEKGPARNDLWEFISRTEQVYCGTITQQ